MQTLKKNYDRVLALMLAVVTFAVSATLVVKSFAVGEKFVVEETTIRPTCYEDRSGAAAELAAHLEADHLWVPPTSEVNGNVLRAFSSSPAFLHDDDLVCGFGEPPIRGDVPNSWFLKHGLPIERDDVLSLDPDGDDFSNLEEYALGANPVDPESHPDVLYKLELAEVQAEDCFLTFASEAGGRANLRKTGGWRAWLETDAILPGGRHRIIRIEDEAVQLLDLVTGRKIGLKRKTETNLPVYRAVFSFSIDAALVAGKSFALGDGFSLPRGGGRCTVKEIDAKSVALEIERIDGSLETKKFEAP